MTDSDDMSSPSTWVKMLLNDDDGVRYIALFQLQEFIVMSDSKRLSRSFSYHITLFISTFVLYHTGFLLQSATLLKSSASQRTSTS